MRSSWIAFLLALFVSSQASAFGHGGGISLYTVNDYNALLVANCQSLQPSATDCQNALVTHSESGITFSGPLNITTGGSYSGNYKSTDPTVPAVRISTTQPVTLHDMIADGPGDVISSKGLSVALTATNVSAWCTNPSSPGAALIFACAASATCDIENSRFAVGGVNITGASTASTLIFKKNAMGNIAAKAGSATHAFQVQHGLFPGGLVDNNLAVNAPGQSGVNDVFNFYQTRGTSASHFVVSANRVLGAYPVNPVSDNYSGGGIIVDGGSDDTATTASQFIDVTASNVVVGTTNYGAALAAGHDNTISSNLIVSDGLALGQPVHAQNVGNYVWNIYGQSGTVFFNNNSSGNSIYWQRVTNFSGTNQTLNNTFLPDCSGTCTNTALSNTATIAEGIAQEAKIINQYFGHY